MSTPIRAVMDRDAVEFDTGAGEPSLPSEIMFFPAGLHTITATRGQGFYQGQVLIDAATADVMNNALAVYGAASKQRPYFDFDHGEKAASAWPVSFSWKEGLGVFAQIEWSEDGARAVKGKSYRAFSPSFYIDDANPAQVTGAPFVMGGLVNDPAFRAIQPLWARNATEEAHKAVTTKQGNTMSEVQSEAVKAASALELETLRKENEALKARASAAREVSANEAVKAAVNRGCIKPEDTDTQSRWVKAILANDESKALLEALPVTAAREVKSSVDVTRTDLSEAVRAFGGERDSAKKAAVFAKDISGAVNKVNFTQLLMNDPAVRAANSFGTLASALVIQQSLPLLKFQLPALTAFSTNFSNGTAAWNQAVTTRTRGIPAVQAFVAGTGYGTSDMTTTDVSVTINKHYGVPLSLNVQEVAATGRDLFGEQGEGAVYSFGLQMQADLLALITSVNFALGGQKTVKAAASFDRATLAGSAGIAKALTDRGVSPFERSLVLNTTYFAQLGLDATLVQLATYQQPDLISEWKLPKVSGFSPILAPNLPATAMSSGTLGGFAATPDALCIAARVPNDYTTALPGASNGSVSVITDPNTGLSVQLVQYVDHVKAEAKWRIAGMYGVAVGQSASLQYITTA